MALLDSEIARCKYELGYNVLTISAEPYIGVARVFELVIQPNLLAGAITTSSTAVTAVAAGALANPVTLARVSVTGLASAPAATAVTAVELVVIAPANKFG